MRLFPRLPHMLLPTVAACLFAVGLAAAAEPQLPPDSAYVQVDADGHLSLNGERQRYWGWIGHFWLEGDLKRDYAPKKDDTPEQRAAKYAKMCEVYDALAQRIADTGFNLVRYWNDCDWEAEWTPGDMSQSDQFGFMLHALNKRGIKVWATSFNHCGGIGPDDVDVLAGDDAEAWRAAMQEQVGKKARVGLRGLQQIGWDARSQAKLKQRMAVVADWRNHYENDIRLGDSPQVVVWELSNEEWYFAHLTRGDWQKLPKYFRDSLLARWTTFLREQYGDDAGLQAAWGSLLPGESLADGNVLLAPLASGSNGKAVNDANPAALAALSAAKQALKREDFSHVRASDVIHFFSQLHVDYKVAMKDYAKTLGKSLALSPMLLDTGDGFRTQAVWLHQHGDASAMCSYLWQTAWDRQHKRFPFISGLDEPPRTAMGIPWAETARIPGKPFFIYEFQQNNPDMYRAEVPYRIAAIGAVQDWDIINFHLFGRPNDPAEAEPYRKRMNYSHAGNGGSIEGVHYKNDEVYTSALKGASLLFRSGALQAAPKPTVMTFGRNTLYDPEGADYGKSFGDLGEKIIATANRYGLHMQVDPTQDKDTVAGPVIDPFLQQANPMRPTDQIEYDWHKGHLRFDLPTGVAYTGFYAQHGGPVEFSNGVRLSDIQIINDAGISYLMTKEEQYVSFALVAQDDKPLAESSSIYCSLVSTSFNNGFKLNPDSVAQGNLGYTGKPYADMTWGDDKADPPVLYARAGGTVTAPALAGMQWQAQDWHFRPVAKGTVGADGVLVIPADMPIFAIELSR
ncbi:MAG: hypothetical protein PF961_07035 [Planctomycetota bacterium]|jgi:hypothetical protein|nr:hypothetical protein [Planctomycetota bacterium]